MNSIAPDAILKKVVESFSDTERGAYAQVATIDAIGIPQVRTLHVHYLPGYERLGFSSHRSSHKWDQISSGSKISGCWFDLYRGIQFRWESIGTLIDGSNLSDTDFLQSMWLKMRKEVREAYWLDNGGQPLDGPLDSSLNVEARTPSHGVVLCDVTLWDIMEIDPKGYRFGRRSIHRKEGGTWSSEVRSILKDY